MLGTALQMRVLVCILAPCLLLCVHMLQARLHPGAHWFAHMCSCSLAHTVPVPVPTPSGYTGSAPPSPLPW